MTKQDNFWGIGSALLGGMYKYFHVHTMQVHLLDTAFILRAGSAFFVAILCGMGGVIGRMIVSHGWKKIKAWWRLRRTRK